MEQQQALNCRLIVQVPEPELRLSAQQKARSLRLGLPQYFEQLAVLPALRQRQGLRRLVQQALARLLPQAAKALDWVQQSPDFARRFVIEVGPADLEPGWLAQGH
jgi:hypothetical protein